MSNSHLLINILVDMQFIANIIERINRYKLISENKHIRKNKG